MLTDTCSLHYCVQQSSRCCHSNALTYLHFIDSAILNAIFYDKLQTFAKLPRLHFVVPAILRAMAACAPPPPPPPPGGNWQGKVDNWEPPFPDPDDDEDEDDLDCFFNI